ncbi:hypothetical protein CKA47_26545 [Pseudomonas aeruginosa]|uniref:hypothetical protein n=1 Tax=Pseudomonas aeruginosa TaxID=287 RepID=UPI00071B55C4|nr:hypothetical protein [Pseudomonas aeruginosa]KSH21788.1 hypothetical protein AO963_19010 [Pseudomonas aeruginosa]RKG09848.1 hypothetical protein CKA44_05145 [Pseudomonas aeruginosa]RKG21393.1 hypothetical protein CKA47_26545 [Pseudomonas aeruginosa]RLR28054.1 hypothetical protein CKA53_34305 [Pseudomonas aeruginosa]RLR31344.1 hypothetical protein CKA50_30635 [Pseudomonas aeruginosa]
MYPINRDALVCPMHLRTARLRLKGMWKDSDEATNDVVRALEAGWFLIPAGREGNYTKRQFEAFDKCFAAAPWVKQIQHEAGDFDERLRARLGVRFERLFSGGRKLTSPLTQALALPHRVARLPLSFEAGAFGPELLVSCLEDTQRVCLRIQDEMQGLEPDWVLAESVDVGALVEHLNRARCVHLLIPILVATSPSYLPREQQGWLWQVQVGNLTVTEYLDRIARRDQEHTDHVRESWRRRFAQIRTLASVLESLPSYHQATITRRLQSADWRFRAKRWQGSLVIDLGDLHEVGARHQLRDGFELVNFVLALDQALERAEPCWDSYHRGEHSAFAQVERMREEMAQEGRPRGLGDVFRSNQPTQLDSPLRAL